MQITSRFHRVQSVSAHDTYLLHVVFQDGTEKVYDMRRLEDHPGFALLFDHPAFIKSVRVDAGGYGISWNDQIDLSCEELWAGGVEA